MMINVLKFGGTSVANTANIKKVATILKEQKKDSIIVVVSAFGGVTDQLLQAGELANSKDQKYQSSYNEIVHRHQEITSELGLSSTVQDALNFKLAELKNILEGIFLINEFSNKTRDKVLGFGELLSSFIISEFVKLSTPDSQLVDSRNLIVTDSSFTIARLLPIKTENNVRSFFSSNPSKITIMPGFVARNENGDMTTLGRGGSDFTAAIVAAALDAQSLEIWTDVSGMYTANPNLVKQAFPIEEISYHEAMELSHFGAKVLYPPTIRPVLDKNIPIYIKNTFEPQNLGSKITNTVQNSNGPIKGITHLQDIALLTLEGNGMVGIPGFSKRLFEALLSQDVNVILITQASSEHSICVAIQAKDSERAKKTVDSIFAYEISLGQINPLTVERDSV